MIKGLEDILNKKSKKIRDMKEGESGFCVPWCCGILKNGDVYLNGNYTIDSEFGGTLKLGIKKTMTGFDLDFSKVERFDEYYDSLDKMKNSYMESGEEESFILVGNVSEEFKRMKKEAIIKNV